MPVVRFLQWLALFLLASFALASIPADAQTVGSPIPAGTGPRAVAVDPVLNKVYIVSEFTNQVIALDGATNATTPIPTGNRPQYIAVNPTNHRVYVTNANDATMTEIDGTTNTVVNTLGVGGNGPIAIDPITNRIFMVRLSSAATDEVTIVDGNTDTWFTIAIDSFQPDAIALNPVTNQVYVATFATGDVRIVDGNTNLDFPHPPAVGVFSQPVALAVNPVTNRTYVVTNDSRGPFGYIDASNNYTYFTAPGHAASPKAVAVNVVTNKIYAAFDGEVMVMNGATDAFTFIPSGTAGAGPVAIGVNPTTDKIYVPNADGTLTVIDGATNATTTLTIPTGATSIGVNPVTNAMYVTAPDSVSVVTGAATDAVQSIPLTTSITPLPGDMSDANPSFTLDASSGFAPVAPPVWRVYYQLDAKTGAWSEASGSGPYTASFSGLSSGSHTLYAYATDTQEGPTVNTGPQSVPLVGSIASYTFTVGTQNAAVALASSANPSTAGQSVTFTATVTDNGAGSAPTGTVAFRDGASTIAGCASVAIASGTAQCTTGALASGTHSIVAAYSGDSAHTAASSSALTQTVNPPAPATPTVSLASAANPSTVGRSVTFTASVSGNAGTPTGSVTFLDGSTAICSSVALSGGTASCATASLAQGTHSITASYSGDGAYNPAVSSALSQTVNAAKVDATISLTSNPNPSDPSTDVIFTATVSGASGTPTGTVTFLDGSSVMCSAVPLNSGSAGCLSPLGSGTHTITASYSGDAAYNAGTSAPYTQNVLATASVGLTSSPNPSNAGQSVTFTIAVSGSSGTPTGTVSVSESNTAIAGCTDLALSNGSATCSTASLAQGQHDLLADYSGDSAYAAATSNVLVQTVNGPVSGAMVALASSANPSSFGHAITLTANISGSAGTATGTIAFKDGNTPIYGCASVALSSGSATCTTSDLAPGSHSITAQYSGDSAYGAASSNALTQTVQGAPASQAAAWKVRTLDPPTHSLDVSGNIADVGPRSAIDAAGNVYMIFSTFDAGTNTGCLSAVKYASADGHVLWQHDLCDAGSTTFGAALALDPSGDVLIAGSFFQGAYFAKLSGATGDKIWDDDIAPSNTLRTALSIGASSSGEVRVATWENDAITIFGFSSDGTLQFQRALTNTLGSAKLVDFAVDAGGNSVVSEVDTDGNNQVAGRISRIDNFGSFVWQVQGGGHLATDPAGNVIAGGTNAVVKYDAATGTALWTVPVPATAVIADAQGNVFATGTWGAQPDDDIVTSKIGSDGTILWSHAYVDPGSSGNGASIALDASGNPVATGFGAASSGSATVQTTLEYAAADGHVLWIATDQDPLGGSFPYAVNASSGGVATIGSIFQSTGGLGGIYAIRYADGASPPPPPATATVALSSSANPSTLGQSVTFTANVTGGSGTPTGSVDFLDGGTAISGCSSVALSSGAATCTTAALGLGSHSITASYSGDGTYGAASSSVLSQSVQSSSSGGPSVNAAAAAAGATVTASSTLSTRYPVAAIIDGDRTGAGFGSGGVWEDANAYTFPDWVQIQFDGAQTIDHVIVYSMQDGYTQPVEPTDTLTFQRYGVTAFDVQAWNGSAWVTVGSVTGNNLVKRTVSFAQVTTDRIRIVINAALNGYSRLAEVEAWTVGSSSGGGGGGGTLADATIELASSVNPSQVGDAVTFTANVSGSAGTPSGTVSFMDGASAICASVTLSSGSATCATSSLAAGSHSVTVSYSGDGSYNAGTSAALTQTVQSSSGGGGTSANVAAASAGATATASSTLSTRYPVSAIIDGDRTGAGFGNGGVWEDANAYAFPDWVQIQLNGTQTIDHVIVYTMQDDYSRPVEPTDTMTFRSYGVTAFDVQAWNGSNWATVGSVTGNDLVKRTVSFAPVSTDRIRIVIDNALNGYSRVAEIEAWSVGGSGGGGGTGGAGSANIALASSANPSTQGQSVTFTATLTGASGTPTGTVDFLDGGTAITGCANVALSGGAATCTTASLSVGSHSITVTYGGDTSYIAGTSSALSQSVQASGGEVNVALASTGATATASSTLSTRYPVSAIIDGDRSGAGFGSGGVWEDANAYTFPDWVQIQFAGTKTIDHVSVYSMQDDYTQPVDPSDTLTFQRYGVTDFMVQGWDGSRWVTLGTATNNDLVKRTVTFAAFTTDRIRVVVTNAENGYSRLAEIEAFGH